MNGKTLGKTLGKTRGNKGVGLAEIIILLAFVLIVAQVLVFCVTEIAGAIRDAGEEHTARAAETTEAREVVVRHVDSFDASAYLTDTFLSEECQAACRKAAARYGLDPYLLMAMVEKESSGDPDVESPDGDIGLLQVNPKWHLDRMERMGVSDLTDPEGNIMVAADYFRELLNGNKQNTALALMKFNMNHARAEELIDRGIISEYAQEVMERAYELRFLRERSGSDE